MQDNNYNDWSVRTTDKQPKKAFEKQYVFVCEGENTECFYFNGLCDNKDGLGIKRLINVICYKRPEGIRSHSHPKCLVRQADEIAGTGLSNFNIETDYIVFVFDLDIYCQKPNSYKGYENILNTLRGKRYKSILGLTNPNFELFLLLHSPDSYTNIIQANEQLLIAPKKTKTHLSEKLFKQHFKYDSKTCDRVKYLAIDANIAIEQESAFLNQDLTTNTALKNLTSTVGKCVQEIINDTPTNVYGGERAKTSKPTRKSKSCCPSHRKKSLRKP